jgi:O-antigen/teichoic acid export membrane protein
VSPPRHMVALPQDTKPDVGKSFQGTGERVVSRNGRGIEANARRESFPRQYSRGTGEAANNDTEATTAQGGYGTVHRPDDGYKDGTIIYDYELRGRQSAGLAALLAIATTLPTPAEDSGGNVPRWLAGLRSRIAHDHLLRNALYLMLNSILQAGFGFVFWIVTARLFSAAAVGQASSLLSATTVIAYLSLLGLNNTIGRFLPTADDKDTVVTAGLLAVGVTGAIIGMGYILLTPVLAPRVDFVAHDLPMAIAFALFTASAAMNLLTDSIFVASRRADITALVDGGIGGLGKIAVALLLIGTGAWGLYCASASGVVLSVCASVLLIWRSLGSRPALRQPVATIRHWLGFSAANYVGNVFYLAPTLAVPLIVLDRLGAAAAAYYFVAFQIASSLFAAALAVEQTFLAEGSRAGVNMRELRRRSARTLAWLCVPASVVVIATGHWLLLLFGRGYYEHGTSGLILMALAAGPVAACNWSLTLLRLSGKLAWIVITNVIFATSICVIAWFGAAHGLTGIAFAWPIGTLLAACVAWFAVPRGFVPRHRISTRGRDGEIRRRGTEAYLKRDGTSA